jgi:hypothetical protein
MFSPDNHHNTCKNARKTKQLPHVKLHSRFK